MSKRAARSRARVSAQRSRSSRSVDPGRQPALPLRALGGIVVLALIGAVMVLVVSSQGSGAPRPDAERAHVQHKVAALFAGIPQRGVVLGQPTAPVTLQVYVDLEDHGNGVQWFDEMLPPILERFVRTNVVRLEFHSLKTDTLNRGPFVMQQTAALAAGAQNRLWNYVDTFVNEQGTEFTNYVNEAFVTGIAEQTPGLKLTEWEQSRTTERGYIVQKDDYIARHRLGLYVTPSFRIGLTSGKMEHLSAGVVFHYHKYIVHTTPSGERYIAGVSPSEWQHPVWLVDARALKKAVEKLI
jgi:protein-disulfide isomerase